eukprot:CAMPEP_0206239500 /NCGR_PEP_ID=MMETSP0047_2-20121206/15416_1 /ASSEMBLY_ACC=CAM_ASM_000192 /TAXON_ID=195065 /ORGANISM="Chroomonas mesostigmatica_cf, Strain CCMP1168" /LENGTH=394 /DNA_ID=CAMNT_0053664175 /DNA_START=38 /DNA_END=1223 /DNA_ORIENTATION=+
MARSSLLAPDAATPPVRLRVLALRRQKYSKPKRALTRALAIYLHHDPFACGHVVLLLDSMKIQTFGTVTAEPLNFPMHNMLLAGELDACQGLDPDGWRAVAPDSIDSVSDLALAEFATGKEIVLKIPDALFPSKGTWLVKCVASTTTRGQKDLYGIKLLFDRFVGDINTLSLADRQVANKEKFSYIFAAISTPAASDKCPASWTPCTTLRALIRSNFPEARTLADIATSNSMRHGAALPKSLRDSRDDAFDAVPARTPKQLQTSPTPLLPATVPPTDRRYNLRSKPTPATAPVASCATLPQASPAVPDRLQSGGARIDGANRESRSRPTPRPRGAKEGGGSESRGASGDLKRRRLWEPDKERKQQEQNHTGPRRHRGRAPGRSQALGTAARRRA